MKRKSRLNRISGRTFSSDFFLEEKICFMFFRLTRVFLFRSSILWWQRFFRACPNIDALHWTGDGVAQVASWHALVLNASSRLVHESPGQCFGGGGLPDMAPNHAVHAAVNEINELVPRA